MFSYGQQDFSRSAKSQRLDLSYHSSENFGVPKRAYRVQEALSVYIQALLRTSEFPRLHAVFKRSYASWQDFIKHWGLASSRLRRREVTSKYGDDIYLPRCYCLVSVRCSKTVFRFLYMHTIDYGKERSISLSLGGRDVADLCNEAESAVCIVKVLVCSGGTKTHSPFALCSNCHDTVAPITTAFLLHVWGFLSIRDKY